MDSGRILQEELLEFSDRLDVECKKKKKADLITFTGGTGRKGLIDVYCDEVRLRGEGGFGDTELSYGHFHFVMLCI